MKTYHTERQEREMTVWGNSLVFLPFLKQNHYMKIITKYIWDKLM